MNKAIKKLLKNKMRFYVIIISVVSLLVIIGLLLVNKNKTKERFWEVLGNNQASTQYNPPQVNNVSPPQVNNTFTYKNYKPLDDISIREAVNLWFNNREKCINTYGNISTWDTSNVTVMRGLFMGRKNFNENISNWDTQNVKLMDLMFYEAETFNQDISRWDTSKVTNMRNMFYGAKSFNQDLFWNTMNVTDMSGMFGNAFTFNGDITLWNTSKVTSMAFMFYNAKSFNRDISIWDTGNVTNMKYMFNGASSFNVDISKWNVIKVPIENMEKMFWGAILMNVCFSRLEGDYFINKKSRCTDTLPMSTLKEDLKREISNYLGCSQ